MPKKKKLWRSIKLDLPEDSSAIPEKNLFYVDTRGTGKKRKRTSEAEKPTKVAGIEAGGESNAKKSKKPKVKVKRRLKAKDIWKDETATADKAPTSIPPQEPLTPEKKPKRQKTKATKRPATSLLAVPERYDFVGSHLTVADPGISINPDPKAQQDLVQRAYEIDQKEKTEREIILAQFRYKSALSGKEDEENEQSGDEKEDNVEEGEVRPLSTKVVSGRRLTQAQRNKKLRKHALEEELKKKKIQKTLKAHIHNLPQMLSQIKEDELTRQSEKAKTAELKKNPNKPARLGKNLFEKEFPEILLTEDVKGGHFRNVQPSTKTVSDQFKRFQERNLIEPRKKNKFKRRYKLKQFDRYPDPKD